MPCRRSSRATFSQGYWRARHSKNTSTHWIRMIVYGFRAPVVASNML